jgi:hypothetical protein
VFGAGLFGAGTKGGFMMYGQSNGVYAVAGAHFFIWDDTQDPTDKLTPENATWHLLDPGEDIANLRFVIYGSPVPEPGPLILTIMGALLIWQYSSRPAPWARKVKAMQDKGIWAK